MAENSYTHSSSVGKLSNSQFLGCGFEPHCRQVKFCGGKSKSTPLLFLVTKLLVVFCFRGWFFCLVILGFFVVGFFLQRMGSGTQDKWPVRLLFIKNNFVPTQMSYVAHYFIQIIMTSYQLNESKTHLIFKFYRNIVKILALCPVKTNILSYRVSSWISLYMMMS